MERHTPRGPRLEVELLDVQALLGLCIEAGSTQPITSAARTAVIPVDGQPLAALASARSSYWKAPRNDLVAYSIDGPGRSDRAEPALIGTDAAFTSRCRSPDPGQCASLLRVGDTPTTILSIYAHLLPQSDEIAAERGSRLHKRSHTMNELLDALDHTRSPGWRFTKVRWWLSE